MSHLVFLSIIQENSDVKINLFVALIAAVVSMFTTGVISFVNNKSGKRNTYINTVTNKRISWMKELKVLVDDFVTSTSKSSNTLIYDKPDEKSVYFNELIHLKNKLILHLNYSGYIDELIIKNVCETYNLVEIYYECFELHSYTNISKRIEYALKNYGDKMFSPLLESCNGNVQTAIEIIKDYYLKVNLPDKQRRAALSHQIDGFNKSLKEVPKKLIDAIELLNNNLFMYTQIYLKLEWNRVKNESGGKIKDRLNKDRYENKTKAMIKSYQFFINDYKEKKLPDFMKSMSASQ